MVNNNYVYEPLGLIQASQLSQVRQYLGNVCGEHTDPVSTICVPLRGVGQSGLSLAVALVRSRSVGAVFAEEQGFMLEASGDDTIYGGNGDDTIRGNAGADTIQPEFGADTVLGTSEEDTVL